MKILIKDYADALLQLSKENPNDISKIAQNFYLYLLKKRKTKILPFILNKLNELEKEKKQIFEIEVESPFPLTLSQKNKIRKFYNKPNVVIKEKINPEILGGIIIRENETILDGSLKINLEHLKEAMCQIPIKS